MSYSVTTLDDSKGPPPLPHDLTPQEQRILGSLMEKQQTTPEYYPLTLNALVSACNQKSNRDPVMELSEREIRDSLQTLLSRRLVWEVHGGRAVRWDHNLDKRWSLAHSVKALITLLLLRGPQTVGELRGRSDRLHDFGSVQEVEETLREMTERTHPLARELPRRPGQKEGRWIHLLGEVAIPDESSPDSALQPREPLAARVERLEQRLADLEVAFNTLKEKLGE